ncbi:MAG: hypothetical protein M0Z76_07480 [Gammaproteobacteria bacterium]|nr:hypothetical protein [Gammaproteobacteria bacterium]
MKAKRALTILACLSLGACATQPAHPGGAARAQADGLAGYPNGKPWPGSKFAKIRLGMSPGEVAGLIGAPTSQHGHITGKGFIPFYFGGDEYRTDWFYRGAGELVFSQARFGASAEKLIYIWVDSHSTGYAK